MLKRTSEFDFGAPIIIPKGAVLYRAATTLETKPQTRYCKDTGKTGVYFSLNSPYLAETMPTEYNEDLIVAEYTLTDNIVAYNDKYSCLYDEESIKQIVSNNNQEIFKLRNGNTRNIPHYATNITGLYNTIEPNIFYAEVFLTENELKNIEFMLYYNFTVKQSVNKWGYYKW